MNKKYSLFFFPKLYLPLLLGFLLGDELCNNYIFQTFSLERKGLELFLYMAFLLAQIVGSPVQAGFSDFYCRKKSLLVSLFFSLCSIGLLALFFKESFSAWVLIIVLLIKGLVGNTLPISLAGVADQQRSDTRFAMGLCTGAMAAGYLLLIFFGKLLPIQLMPYPISSVFIILTILCMLFFVDLRDLEKRVVEKIPGESFFKTTLKEFKLIWQEIKEIKKELNKKKTLLALFTFFLWEVSQYSIHMLDVDLRSRKFSNLTTAMVFGYLFGLFLLWLTKNKEDKKVIKWGYVVCIGSVLPIYIIYPFLPDQKFILLSCYFLFNLGMVFLAPSLFSILAGERQPHEQGKIFGLLESTDTVAFLVASVIDIFYLSRNLNSIFIISFSFFVFVFSIFFYNRFSLLKID